MVSFIEKYPFCAKFKINQEQIANPTMMERKKMLQY